MKVILQENIESLGRVGDIVVVADGYGRNYLLPRKKALLADERNVKVINHQKLLASHKKARTIRDATVIAKRIEGLSLSLSRLAGENDKLFGSVTTADIESALRAEHVEVERRQIRLEEPIKNLGVFTVEVRVHPEVSAKVKLWVVRADQAQA